MISQKSLFESLDKTQSLSQGTRLDRFSHNPVRYIYAIGLRYFSNIRKNYKKKVTTKTFYQKDLNIYLPSSTDIYLTKGKSHDSEIRLSRFLIRELNDSDCFLDIGAHIGFFTLLASQIVGKDGKVFAVEPATNSYEILSQNSEQEKNIETFNFPITNESKEVKFYEFPNVYSEYNTMKVDQFNDAKWYKENKPEEKTVNAISLDDLIDSIEVIPEIIKIDVEGAEFSVLTGGHKLLTEQSPIIVLEFLSKERSNQEHKKAEKLLLDSGFHSFRITNEGKLQHIMDVEEYLTIHTLESDNIVFSKHLPAQHIP